MSGVSTDGAYVKNFTVEGSIDDSSWDLLYTGIIPHTLTPLEYSDFTFDNSTDYRYYKLNFSDSDTSDSGRTIINELQGYVCTADCGGTPSSTPSSTPAFNSSGDYTSVCDTDGSSTKCYYPLLAQLFYLVDFTFFGVVLGICVVIIKKTFKIKI